MKTFFFLLIIGCLGLGFRFSMDTGKMPKKPNSIKAEDASSGFAVVELFTSEGCSSCPQADRVLAAIQHDYEAKAVYILAYHVDYWDKLGWKDVFSNPAYSKRQYQYADWFHLESVYTPQVVIDGTKEFVGSNESGVRSVISESLEKKATFEFELTSSSISNGKIRINYSLDAEFPNSSLVLNLVERFATTSVLEGENKGRELAHVQIVRDQKTVPSNKSGTSSLTIPAGIDKNNLEVICFVQDNRTGKITGAAKSRIE